MTVANDKDIPWNAIIGTELEEPALQAFDAEFDNMTAHGFEVLATCNMPKYFRKHGLDGLFLQRNVQTVTGINE